MVLGQHVLRSAKAPSWVEFGPWISMEVRGGRKSRNERAFSSYQLRPWCPSLQVTEPVTYSVSWCTGSTSVATPYTGVG